MTHETSTWIEGGFCWLYIVIVLLVLVKGRKRNG